MLIPFPSWIDKGVPSSRNLLPPNEIKDVECRLLLTFIRILSLLVVHKSISLQSKLCALIDSFPILFNSIVAATSVFQLGLALFKPIKQAYRCVNKRANTMLDESIKPSLRSQYKAHPYTKKNLPPPTKN